MQNITRSIFSSVIIVILFLIYIRYIERRSIYFPSRVMETTPAAISLSFEDVNFRACDSVKLNGWFILHKDARDTVLFCHGNAGNISHRLEKIAIFHNMGRNVFIFDYRGYGKSEGSPSEKGLYKDVEAAYRYLIDQRSISTDNIIAYGESLGGAIVIDLASKQKVKALIIEDTFSSVKDMVKIIYPFLPHFILQSKLDSVSKIRNIKVPKLIIHSVDDEIVPFNLGEKLFQAACPPKEFLKLRGGHNSAFWDSRETFLSGISSFLKSLKDVV